MNLRNRDTARRVLNFFSFDVGWAVTVFMAARGDGLTGPITVLVLTALHLIVGGNRPGVIRFFIGCTLIGFLIDTVLGAVGIYRYPTPPAMLSWLCPLWLTGLWLNFAHTLDGCMDWLQGRPLIAAILGGIMGPIAYYAGGQIGAMEITAPPALAWPAIAITWALVIPGLLILKEKTMGAPSPSPEPAQ